MAEQTTDLERQYCPPLDPALFHAVLSDYDLASADQIEALRSILDALRSSAQDESTNDFDPSGTSNAQDDQASQSAASDRALSLPPYSGQASTETDSTSASGLSHNLEGLDLGSAFASADTSSEIATQWADLTESRRGEIMMDMFPSMKSIDVVHAVRLAGDNYGRVVEELLNKVFLYDDVDDLGRPTIQRGIEGFAVPTQRSRRSKKSKPRNQRRTSSTPAYDEESAKNSSVASRSRWDRAKEDINFVNDRCHIPRSIVSSLYHTHGASLAATIAALCDDSLVQSVPDSGGAPALIQMNAYELAADFPRLSPSQTKALVMMTFPSTTAAHELARALSTSLNPTALVDGYIMPTYKSRSPSPPLAIATASSRVLSSSSHTTDRLIADRTHAHRQASAAYRASKSKPLMGGAAAYYSSIARDNSSILRQRESAAAQDLVMGQSRPGQLDLHGVTVHDGVRIARQEADRWWQNEGREWARAGKAMNTRLIIVTGKGHHSSGGRGKLGPAVGAMLVREGWKVEIGDGTIDVVGKARS